MTGLPKFVRDHMGGTSAPTSHPDADLLTAFSENSCSVQERQQLVEHLSACADCREIIFLSQPQAVETQNVLAPKTGRFTWMAWASVAAIIVVVASAVIVQREQVTKIPSPVTVTTTTTPPPPEAKAADKSNELVYEVPPSAGKDRKQMIARDSQSTAPKPSATPEPMVTAKSTAADESFTVPRGVPAAPLAPGSNQNAIIDGNISQQKTDGPSQNNVAGQLQQQAQLSPNRQQGPSNSANSNSGNTGIANIATRNDRLAKAEAEPAAKVQKKQARSAALDGVVAGYSMAASAQRPAIVQPATRADWQISPDGTLERSSSADNWSPVLSETGAKFHVVSVIGYTIWAGGERGALYVSRDDGSTWTPVKLDSAATITSIHFSDDSHGTLQTSNGETWKTSDGGKVWEKQ